MYSGAHQARFYFGSKHYEPSSGSILIWVHIVCNIGVSKNISRREEQTTKAVTIKPSPNKKIINFSVFFRVPIMKLNTIYMVINLMARCNQFLILSIAI